VGAEGLLSEDLLSEDEAGLLSDDDEVPSEADLESDFPAPGFDSSDLPSLDFESEPLLFFA
jgi:hypothetical protein